MRGNNSKSVYFIKAGNFVKIGIATDPEKRLIELQTANPVVLKLVYSMPGDEELEKLLHKTFDEYRENGEWFRFELGLKSFINGFKNHGYSIKQKDSNIAPITLKDATINKLSLNEDHEKIISFLKFVEVEEGFYNTPESQWGIHHRSIVGKMAMEHKIPEQKTRKLIKDLYEFGIIFAAKKECCRLVITWDEIKDHKLKLESGGDYYSKEYDISEDNLNSSNRTPESDREKIRGVQELIKELEEDCGGRAPTDVLIEVAEERWGITPLEFETLIRQLKRKGVIYEPIPGYLRVG